MFLYVKEKKNLQTEWNGELNYQEQLFDFNLGTFKKTHHDDVIDTMINNQFLLTSSQIGK